MNKQIRGVKEDFKDAFIFTLIWGMMSHAYIFFNAVFSHDSLAEFNGYAHSNHWKISIGRGFVPIYREFTRGSLALPWLIGVLTILWASITVFFIVKMFDVKSKILLH